MGANKCWQNLQQTYQKSDSVDDRQTLQSIVTSIALLAVAFLQ